MRFFSLLALSLLGPTLFGCSTSIVVNNSGDSGSGTLRQAVTDVCPKGVITFGLPSGTVIALSSGPITLARSVAINGPSPLQLAISGGGNQQIFVVTGNPVVIRSLILKDGLSPVYPDFGAAIDNSGTLTLQGVLLESNTDGAVNNGAGAILSVGQCTFRNNISSGIASAIDNSGKLEVASSQFLSNQTSSSSTLINEPGATLDIESSTFSNNTGFVAGAICNGLYPEAAASAFINRCTFTGNSGTVMSSAVDNLSGTMTISRSVFRANNGPNYAAYNFLGSFLTIQSSTIDSNGDNGTGGGVDNQGTLTIIDSAITHNQSGIYSTGPFSISHSTIAGNMSGIFVDSPLAPSYIAFSTITGNAGGGVTNIFGATMSGVILAGNSPAACNAAPNPIVSAGYNLSDDSSCNFTQPTDLQNTNPVLGVLANNGGPTQTQALLPGSPAIDTGGTTGCSPTDQRGVPAPQNGVCDRGAYELIQ